MEERSGLTLLDVVLPLPIPGPLTYTLGPEMDLPPRGTRVVVPVGRRNMVGVAWDEVESVPDGVELKAVVRVLDASPLLPKSILDLVSWASSYYFYPLGMAVSEILPPGLLSARNKGIAKILSGRGGRGAAEPCKASWEEGSRELVLTGCQAEALSRVSEVLSSRTFGTILLHGVTGSGKTEVYLRAAEKALAQGRQVLIMVPEISMTAQTLGRVTSRFGSRVTVLHSGLTDAQRREQWMRVRRGDSSLVVGTRSAVFAPLEDIGLIVVDEEHDSSYKQDARFRYNARDLSVYRGRYHNAAVILGSATPSVTSYWNARSGRYRLVEMPRRVSRSMLPLVQIVDRREGKICRTRGDPPRPPWLSIELMEAMRETLDRGRQVLLFLNRRGFAGHVFCPECGHVFRCKNCEVALTYHKKGADIPGEGLLCHYCGYRVPALPLCPKCQGQSVRASGFGTERIEEDVARLFPGVVTARLDRDTATTPGRLRGVLEAFHKGRIQVMVGTQMVSKGHDFPGLTLVGVVWADLSLNQPEFHAAERTFQLLMQVAGRAGRRDHPGRVIVQTHLPDHYALRCVAANDYQGLFQHELSLRRSLAYPPFGRLIRILFSGSSRSMVLQAADVLAGAAREACRGRPGKDGVQVLGPAEAPVFKIRGRYRYQFLLKSSSIRSLRRVCAAVSCRAGGVLGRAVRMEIDVDPYSLT